MNSNILFSLVSILFLNIILLGKKLIKKESIRKKLPPIFKISKKKCLLKENFNK